MLRAKSAIKPFDNLSLCLSNSFDTLNKILNNPSLETKYDISGAATVSETYEIANIVEDMAAEQKARAVYEHLILLTDNQEVIQPLLFLRQREVVHYERFKELLEYYQKMGY